MNTWKRRTTAAVCSLLTLFFILFCVDETGYHILTLSGNVGANTFLFAGAALIYGKILQAPAEKKPWLFQVVAGMLCAFFAGMSLVGKYYEYFAQKDARDFGGPGLVGWGKIALAFLGGMLFFGFFIRGVELLRNLYRERILAEGKGWPTREGLPVLQKVYTFLFGKWSFLKQMLVLALFWLPHFIIRYPGIMVTDGIVCLNQYYGKIPFTTQHPIWYTLILGRFMDLGKKMGALSHGLFLLVLIQTLLMLVVIVYTLQVMERLGMSPFWRLLTLLCFAILPTVIAYTTTSIVDAPYGAAYLLFMDEMAVYFYDRESYGRSPKHLLLCALAVFAMYFRHNGSYIVAIMVFVILVREVCFLVKKKRGLVSGVLVLLALVLPLLAGKAQINGLYDTYEVQRISTRAIFSLPSQQIARCMISHGKELSREELETIARVMVWKVEEYDKEYNPLSFDGVKDGFNNDATKEELLDYLKVWLKLLARYPKTCISATLNQNYSMISPLESNSHYYGGAGKTGVKRSPEYKDAFVGPKALRSLKNRIVEYYESFDELPFVGILVNEGFLCFTILVICLYGLKERNWRLLLFQLPNLLTFGVAFVGPKALGCARYMYPAAYAMPLVLGFFILKPVYKKWDTRNEKDDK